MSSSPVAAAQRRNLYGESIGPLNDDEWSVEPVEGKVRLKLTVKPDRLPPDAKVALFVHLRLRSQVFDCGTVSNVSSSPTCSRRGDDVLEFGGRELRDGKVEIRIRDPRIAHRCIAWGVKGHSPEFIEGDGELGLAIRQMEDLGSEAYRLRLCPREVDQPTLEVSMKLNGLFYTAMLKDQGVRAAIIPFLIESVLRRMVSDCLVGSPEALRADGDWRSSWLAWAERIAGPMPACSDAERSNSDAMSTAVDDCESVDDCERWIETTLKKVRERMGRMGQAVTMHHWLADQQETPE